MDYPIVALIVVLVVILVLVYAFAGAGTLMATNKEPTTLKLNHGSTNIVIPQHVDYDNANPGVPNLIAGIVLNNSPAGSLVRFFNGSGHTVLIGYGTSTSGAVDNTKYAAGLTNGQFTNNHTMLCTKQGIRAQDWRCSSVAS